MQPFGIEPFPKPPTTPAKVSSDPANADVAVRVPMPMIAAAATRRGAKPREKGCID